MYSENFQQNVLDTQEKLSVELVETLPSLIYSVVPSVDGLLIRTAPQKLRALSFFIRNSTLFQCRVLVDIAVVDKCFATGRFSINYLFLSPTLNSRLILQVFAKETTTMPSLAVPFTNGQRLFAAAG